MSNTDSFIEEVAEEVRRDRFFRYLRRYGWIAVVVVLVLVIGAAVFEWRRSQDRAAAEAAGDALYAAAGAENAAARAAALGALDLVGPARAPKLMLEADALAEADEAQAAAERLATLAADPAQPRLWRDLAALKRVNLLPALPPAEKLAILEPLAAPGAPYRVLAVEAQALARAEAGETETAIGLLQGLLADQGASAGLRLRAAQLIVALGGQPEGF